MALVHVSRAETSRRELTADGAKISGGTRKEVREITRQMSIKGFVGRRITVLVNQS